MSGPIKRFPLCARRLPLRTCGRFKVLGFLCLLPFNSLRVSAQLPPLIRARFCSAILPA